MKSCKPIHSTTRAWRWDLTDLRKTGRDFLIFMSGPLVLYLTEKVIPSLQEQEGFQYELVAVGIGAIIAGINRWRRDNKVF